MDPSDQYQQMSMHQQVMGPNPKAPAPAIYSAQAGYPDPNTAHYQTVPYEAPQQPGSIPYGAVPPPSMIDHSYADQNVFPTPPMQQPTQQQPSPEAYSPGDYQHQDLADLLGTLKVNETGTGKKHLPL